LDRYQALLSDDECVRWQRFLFEKDRHRFLVARAMLRDVLSRYVGWDPRSLVFEYSAYGKPALAHPPGLPVRFNLSHSGGLAVCAVTQRHDVGVDVESPDRQTDVLGLAQRFFAKHEVDQLRRKPPEDQKWVFFEFWTLKEAYIKARGQGLSIPLDAFAFSLAADRPPWIAFVPPVDDNPDDWQFAQVFLGSQYPIAVALRLPRDRQLTVQVREVVPLGRTGEPKTLPPNRCCRWLL
jgi:4'-phosphopantetheinyl transferase